MITEPPPHAVIAPRACPAPATRPDSLEAIFEDHVGRRLGLLAALTRGERGGEEERRDEDQEIRRA